MVSLKVQRTRLLKRLEESLGMIEADAILDTKFLPLVHKISKKLGALQPPDMKNFLGALRDKVQESHLDNTCDGIAAFPDTLPPVMAPLAKIPFRSICFMIRSSEIEVRWIGCVIANAQMTQIIQTVPAKQIFEMLKLIVKIADKDSNPVMRQEAAKMALHYLTTIEMDIP